MTLRHHNHKTLVCESQIHLLGCLKLKTMLVQNTDHERQGSSSCGATARCPYVCSGQYQLETLGRSHFKSVCDSECCGGWVTRSTTVVLSSGLVCLRILALEHVQTVCTCRCLGGWCQTPARVTDQDTTHVRSELHIAAGKIIRRWNATPNVAANSSMAYPKKHQCPGIVQTHVCIGFLCPLNVVEHRHGHDPVFKRVWISPVRTRLKMFRDAIQFFVKSVFVLYLIQLCYAICWMDTQCAI